MPYPNHRLQLAPRAPGRCAAFARRLPVAAALALAVLLAPSAARAHAWSVSYAELRIEPDQRSLRYVLRIPLADLGEALGLGADAPATAADLRARAASLVAYVGARIELSADRTPCPPLDEVGDVAAVDGFAVLTWPCSFGHTVGRVTLDYGLFFDLDPNHTSLLSATIGEDRVSTPLTADGSRFTWDLAAATPNGFAGFVASGADHIFFGYDHIGFLLALLLVAAIAATGTGLGVRGLGPGLRYTAAIVTSFTVAHSLTLIPAALGWLSLPSRLVESLIAASIALVCLENLVRPDPPRRWLLTFGFGLVHGLGFASMLRPLLPEGVVAPLVAFNLGVELGQLAIVAAAFPALHLAARQLGGARYRRYIATPGSIALGLLGALWLVQRAFDLTLPS